MKFHEKNRYFFTRKYDGPMNLVGHQAFDIDRKKNRIAVGAMNDVIPQVAHGSHCEIVYQATPAYGTVIADSVATNKKGLMLTMPFADCPPVMLYDPVTEVVALLHCGWKPLVAGIIPNTIKRMNEAFGCFTEQMEAVIGPGICVKCYEVGPEVLQKFGWAIEVKANFDLEGEIMKQLCACGIRVRNIERTQECTKHEINPLVPGIDIVSEKYYSFRRDKSDPLEANMAAVTMV